MEADEVIEQIPNPQIAQWKFLLTQGDEVASNKDELKAKLMDVIKTNSKFLFNPIFLLFYALFPSFHLERSLGNSYVGVFCAFVHTFANAYNI